MRSLLAAGAVCLAVLYAHAEDALDRVHFESTNISLEVQENREIAKDSVRVNLIASANGPDWNKISSETGQLVESLRNEVGATGGIDLVLGNRLTSMLTKAAGSEAASAGVYWKVDQGIILTSKDPGKLYAFLQKARTGIIVANISYSISPEVQRKVENEVTDLSLTELYRQARHIQETVGAKSFDVAQLTVSTRVSDGLAEQVGAVPPKQVASSSQEKPQDSDVKPSPSGTAVVSCVMSAVVRLKQ